MLAGPNGSGKSTLKSRLPNSLFLALLMDAIRVSNRAYVFDNSSDNKDKKHTWLAEITDGKELDLKSDQIPAWFKRFVLDKINPPAA